MPDETPDRKTLLRKAYGQATTALREKYADEFAELYAAKAKDLGVDDYAPRLSPEEKARREVAVLLEQFPALREELAAG